MKTKSFNLYLIAGLSILLSLNTYYDYKDSKRHDKDNADLYLVLHNTTNLVLGMSKIQRDLVGNQLDISKRIPKLEQRQGEPQSYFNPNPLAWPISTGTCQRDSRSTHPTGSDDPKCWPIGKGYHAWEKE